MTRTPPDDDLELAVLGMQRLLSHDHVHDTSRYSRWVATFVRFLRSGVRSAAHDTDRLESVQTELFEILHAIRSSTLAVVAPPPADRRDSAGPPPRPLSEWHVGCALAVLYDVFAAFSALPPVDEVLLEWLIAVVSLQPFPAMPSTDFIRFNGLCSFRHILLDASLAVHCRDVVFANEASLSVALAGLCGPSTGHYVSSCVFQTVAELALSVPGSPGDRIARAVLQTLLAENNAVAALEILSLVLSRFSAEKVAFEVLDSLIAAAHAVLVHLLWLPSHNPPPDGSPASRGGQRRLLDAVSAVLFQILFSLDRFQLLVDRLPLLDQLLLAPLLEAMETGLSMSFSSDGHSLRRPSAQILLSVLAKCPILPVSVFGKVFSSAWKGVFAAWAPFGAGSVPSPSSASARLWADLCEASSRLAPAPAVAVQLPGVVHAVSVLLRRFSTALPVASFLDSRMWLAALLLLEHVGVSSIDGCCESIVSISRMAMMELSSAPQLLPSLCKTARVLGQMDRDAEGLVLAVEFLCSLAQAPEWELRDEAVGCLGELMKLSHAEGLRASHQAVASILMDALLDREEYVAGRACRVLAMPGLHLSVTPAAFQKLLLAVPGLFSRQIFMKSFLRYLGLVPPATEALPAFSSLLSGLVDPAVFEDLDYDVRIELLSLFTALCVGPDSLAGTSLRLLFSPLDIVPLLLFSLESHILAECTAAADFVLCLEAEGQAVLRAMMFGGSQAAADRLHRAAAEALQRQVEVAREEYMQDLSLDEREEHAMECD